MSQPVLQSVDNALRILELFGGQTKEMSLTDISRELSLGKSTTHRLLSTLANRDFIEQNQANGLYRLGFKNVYLGTIKLNSLNIVDECRHVISALSTSTKEATHLSFYSNWNVTVAAKIYGANQAVMSSIVGSRLPAYASASGKMFLSCMPQDILDAMLQKYGLPALTPYTITDPAKLKVELASIKERGYAEDWQESDEGLVCFAAPVLDRNNVIIATISVSGAMSRMEKQKEFLIGEVRKAAEAASICCGWRQENIAPGTPIRWGND